jgi:hypothetical protein
VIVQKRPAGVKFEVSGQVAGIIRTMSTYFPFLRRIPFKLLAFIFVCAIVGGCASNPSSSDREQPPTILPSQADLAGTWKWISVKEGATGKIDLIQMAFYMRFYADGTAASWPTPNGAVSRGVYALTNGRLSLPDAPLSDSVQIRATHEKFWFWNKDGDTCLYYRVSPDLEPGKLP